MKTLTKRKNALKIISFVLFFYYDVKFYDS